MSIKTTLVALAFALVLAGCKGGDTTSTSTAGSTAGNAAKGATSTDNAAEGTIVGTWEADNPGADNTKALANYDFKDDKTYSMTVSMNQKVGDKDVKVGNETHGTYTLDANKLTLHISDTKMTSEDAAMQAQFDKMNSKMADALKSAPDTKGTLAWKDKDNVTFTTEPVTVNGQEVKSQTFVMKRKA